MPTAAAGAPPGAAVLHLPTAPSALGRPGPQLRLQGAGAVPSAAAALAAAGVQRRHRHPGIDGLGVFAVDDRSVQLHWTASDSGPLHFAAGAARATVVPEAAATPRRLPCGPGTVVLDDLVPDQAVPVWVETATGRAELGMVRTLPRPAGALLGQLATITDIHLGDWKFGPEGLEDRWPLPAGGPFPMRCATAAAAEAAAWGATHLVVKGDLTRDSEPAEFEAVGRFLAAVAMSSDVVLGNHDVRHGVDGTAVLARSGIDARPEARIRDLPGLRLVLAHSPTPRNHWGVYSAEEIERITAAAAGAGGPCMVVSHHLPLTGVITSHYPPGVRAAPSRAMLRRLAAANPASVVVAGHTHRHRLRWSAGIVCAETGSTKDHPGTWTGYRVFEGGLVQTTRRIAAPDVLTWTEATRRTIAGQWGRWSPGVLADRSWALDWPAPTTR